MGVKKYYAVKIGRTPGIYLSWADCKAQVNGYPGAIYKGFETKEEADLFLGIASTQSKEDHEEYDATWAKAYVDGSYDIAQKRFACGGIILFGDEEIEFSQVYEDETLAEMRNVAGEIKGAEYAIDYCIAHGWKRLVIYHDYQGIASWCNGTWKCNKIGTMQYRAYCLEAQKQLELAFVKVKGHSGVKYNELADKLAKKALGKI